MTKVTLKGNQISLAGDFPKVGDKINEFSLTANDLSEVSLKDLSQKTIILNIFPSLDTPTCSMSVMKFNQEAANLPDCLVLCISKDLPFAQARFCGANDIKNVTTLSAFRNGDFARQLGIDIVDGPIRGLLARSVFVLNDKREVVYAELVPEITQEPNYAQCLNAIK